MPPSPVRAMAEYRGWPIEVIVGEEISTRGGHLLGLYMRERIRPWHSLKDSIAMVHEQGGLAIIAHPLPPYPLCASERTIRKLMEEADPIFHPDGMEGFNPTTARMHWSRKAPALAEELGIAATGGSDAHKATNVGSTADHHQADRQRGGEPAQGARGARHALGRERPTRGRVSCACSLSSSARTSLR